MAPFDLQGAVKKMRRLSSKFEKIFEMVIDERVKMMHGGKDSGEDCKDFLEFLLRLKDEGDSKTPLTMMHVEALLMAWCFLFHNILNYYK